MAKIKCSICSYQFNIWYVGHVSTQILIWFLVFGQGSEVYLTLTTGCIGLALLPSAAHYYFKRKKNKYMNNKAVLALINNHIPNSNPNPNPNPNHT